MKPEQGNQPEQAMESAQGTSILNEGRPWPFSRAQLTAGLRNHNADNKLTIREIKEFELPDRRPSVGRIRGLEVVCQGSAGRSRYQLVLKEPQGTTRAGMAGVGRREVAFYHNLAEQIPIGVPVLLADQPDGEWMVFEYIQMDLVSHQWTVDQYLLAIENLVTLHDRFWNLGDDLGIYNWLGRPLTRDFEIYLQAATNGAQRLLKRGSLPIFHHETGYLKMLQDLIGHAGVIAQELRKVPATLIHGDYWPGNLIQAPSGNILALDWQMVGIGPGLLDLVKFVQASLWNFSPLPLSQSALTSRYRKSLAEKNSFTWAEKEWQRDWNFALLWVFLTEWVDLFAYIPASMLETRQADIQSIWLDPVNEAIRRLGKG